MAAIGELRYTIPCPVCGDTVEARVDVDVTNVLIPVDGPTHVQIAVRSIAYRGECDHVAELNSRRIA